MDKYQELINKYPKIFPDGKVCLDIEQGWITLLDKTLECVQSYIDHNEATQTTIPLIKEKYGVMSVFARNTDDFIEGMFWLLEHLSEYTCDQCGAPGELYGEHWLKTRCPNHKD
jgi:hypothetical protein